MPSTSAQAPKRLRAEEHALNLSSLPEGCIYTAQQKVSPIRRAWWGDRQLDGFAQLSPIRAQSPVLCRKVHACT